MALALASAVAWRAWTALVRSSTVALRSSPMAGVAQEVAEPGEEGPAATEDEGGRVGEDRRDRDTKLSRALNP
jgi:hypothetical protein